MDYYESASGIRIGYDRCIHEITRTHGFCDDQWESEFRTECWDIHSKDGSISAQKLLDWLGY